MYHCHIHFTHSFLESDEPEAEAAAQAEQFMDICINSSPNMVWFKDKEGVHEIVNESFCKVVNKTKEQAYEREIIGKTRLGKCLFLP